MTIEIPDEFKDLEVGLAARYASRGLTTIESLHANAQKLFQELSGAEKGILSDFLRAHSQHQRDYRNNTAEIALRNGKMYPVGALRIDELNDLLEYLAHIVTPKWDSDRGFVLDPSEATAVLKGIVKSCYDDPTTEEVASVEDTFYAFMHEEPRYARILVEVYGRHRLMHELCSIFNSKRAEIISSRDEALKAFEKKLYRKKR